MPGQVQKQVHKHHRIARVLADEIRSGVHADGSRLPGEHALRERFGVSRTTLRQALQVLGEEGLIATHAGIGSFVTFDGTPLDHRLGWTRALAEQGTELTTEILRFEEVSDPELAGRLRTPSDAFIALDRVRRLPEGLGVSLEHSRVPAVGSLAGLPGRGLDGGSLSRTLIAAGRITDSGEGTVSVRGLGDAEADALHRQPGESFLHLDQVYRAADGSVVEQVSSLLDPARFELHVSSGRGGRS
ncbi:MULTISPECIES: GntR family transcriptional regulator [Streptomyces]|uniref:GntR family transcriptional regulator n=1 Tax=Streptomyces spinosisporus TaxID=2927582 RepID=A0ABS9XHW1_9ACTN|nr:MULTISPECIES: GntR family transcriptional regulator [Streptomyces]MCI3241649.1 GntR family transcriptional regulator [Streptomyces spinosisporus]WUB33670.1 GntR family transcriptional regulator [Streptomyces sp. NBC_00588]